MTKLLDPTAVFDLTVDACVGAFEAAVNRSAESAGTTAWLGLVSVSGHYPQAEELQSAGRVHRSLDRHRLAKDMLDSLYRMSAGEAANDCELEVLDNAILIDVSHTAKYDLHTGIQRVVHELVERWLSHHDVVLVNWNEEKGALTRLSNEEHERFRLWHQHLHPSGAQLEIRTPLEMTGKAIVPWRCALVIPELVVNHRACSAYSALSTTSLLRHLSLVAYDLVPMTAAETVADGMSTDFAHYLTLVKHADRLVAISETTAADYRAFGQMLHSQGLTGPTITARPIPTSFVASTAEELLGARREFGLSNLPLVVVVGSHEPRKNHSVVLEAAESMWRSGVEFELVFVGGSTWGSRTFDEYLEQLIEDGFPVRRYRRVAERSLWALYTLAQFSVFPSLLEGYGLPIAESLAAGTPVITSNYGAMAEVAADGGAILVDPRDSAQVASAMTSLLRDNELLSQLAAEARARVFAAWDDYATVTWDDLTLRAN